MRTELEKQIEEEEIKEERRRKFWVPVALLIGAVGALFSAYLSISIILNLLQ